MIIYNLYIYIYIYIGLYIGLYIWMPNIIQNNLLISIDNNID